MGDNKHYFHRNNYDITFKYISDLFKNDFLDALGIHVGRVVQMVPTNVITIETTDLEVDFLCLLDNDTYLHLEFQTTSKEDDLDRFMKYDALLYDKLKKPIRTFVIYGADVSSAKSEQDYGSILYRVNNMFLNSLDGDSIVTQLVTKVECDGELCNEDLSKLILLPLMKTSVPRSKRVIDSGQIAKHIRNKNRFHRESSIENRIVFYFDFGVIPKKSRGYVFFL